MNVKIKSGDQNFELEVEPTMSMTLKDATVEFEKPLRISLSGDGTMTCGLPVVVFARSFSVTGNVKLETVERMLRPQKVRGVQSTVLDAIVGEMTPEEIAEKTGLETRQVQNAVNILLRKKRVGRRGNKLYKIGATYPNPKLQRSPEIPVVEGKE